MLDLDIHLTQLINNLSGAYPLLDATMIGISSMGVPFMVIAVAGQWWLQFDRRHHRHILVAAGLSFLLGLAINQVILLLVHRIRPYDAGVTHLLIQPSVDPSFPSDHATASFAIVFAFFFNAKYRLGAAFLVAASVIAFSRIYIGTHYLGDLAGGGLTALLGAFFVSKFYREGTRTDRFVTDLF